MDNREFLKFYFLKVLQTACLWSHFGNKKGISIWEGDLVSDTKQQVEILNENFGSVFFL